LPACRWRAGPSRTSQPNKVRRRSAAPGSLADRSRP
jgi:hypothetical protein